MADKVRIDLQAYRPDKDDKVWDLPPWGHPISQGVMPLFITAADRIFPVGTALNIGKTVALVLTATHNVLHAFEYDERLAQIMGQDVPSSVILRQAGFSVLHQRMVDGELHIALWPIKTADGAPPTDLVIATPLFSPEIKATVNRLSFDIPGIGDTVSSVGYCNFFPREGGIPASCVQDRSFDWRKDYSHTLRVVEGKVRLVFAQRFATSYLNAPCFMFDAAIEHAQSGGPIYNADGMVCGINSADATGFFNRPATLGSLLFPLTVTPLRASMNLGPFTLKTKRPLRVLIEEGWVQTDGSEGSLRFIRSEDGRFASCTELRPEHAGFVHNDFSAYQNGIPASVTKDDLLVFIPRIDA